MSQRLVHYVPKFKNLLISFILNLLFRLNIIILLTLCQNADGARMGPGGPDGDMVRIYFLTTTLSILYSETLIFDTNLVLTFYISTEKIQPTILLIIFISFLHTGVGDCSY